MASAPGQIGVGARCPLILEIEDGVVGYWHRLRLNQVITNLLVNASNYAPGAPVELRVARIGDRARMLHH